MIRKKLIAGLSASVMAIAASATSVSAFADEVNLVQEQKELQTYVDSFAAEDENLYEIATYLSDNDFSLEETKQIMERCENSQDEMAEIVAAQSSGLDYFHNEDYVNPITQCYIFMRGVYYGEEDTRIDLHFPEGMILTKEDIHMNPLITASKKVEDVEVRNGTTKYDFRCYAYDTNSIGRGNFNTLANFDVPYKSVNLKKETDLMESITATYKDGSNSKNAKSVSFAAGCYYIGDLNHDGNVDDIDATFLVDYLNGKVSLGGDYIDMSSNEAAFLRGLAADVNRDGKVDKQDLLRLNKYLAGLVYPL